MYRLSEMRAPITAGSTSYAKYPMLFGTPSSFMQESWGSGADASFATHYGSEVNTIYFYRSDDRNRLSKFDDVGVCLNKDQGSSAVGNLPGRASGYSTMRSDGDPGCNGLFAYCNLTYCSDGASDFVIIH